MNNISPIIYKFLFVIFFKNETSSLQKSLLRHTLDVNMPRINSFILIDNHLSVQWLPIQSSNKCHCIRKFCLL